MAEPKLGDFATVRIKGQVGFMIRLGQWLNGGGFSDFEHAFLYLGVAEDGIPEIIEAQPGGAQVTDLRKYDGERLAWSTDRIPLTDAQRLAVVRSAERYRYTPYGFLDYLSIAIKRLRLPIPGVRKRIQSSRTMICSQLVAQAYKDAGVDLFPGRFPGDVTPADLYRLIR